jgi:hypothetical protein
MDKVLTRKMFRDRYFKKHKPKRFNKGGIANIQHFQEGGLTSREKAIIAAQFAAPLLQSTQRQGESPLTGTLRAVGQGAQTLPATLIALEKAKPKKAARLMTDAELKAAKLPKGTSAQIDSEGKINVISKPSADALKSAFGAKQIKAILGDVATKYIELDKPVGPLSYRTIAPITNVLGTKGARKFAELKADIQKTTSFLGKAISGAAVSEQEAKRIEKMIPQLGDTEVTFEGKMKALNNYLNQTIALAEDNDATFEDAMNIMDRSGATELITFDLGQDIKFKRVGDTIDLTAGGS